MAPFFALKNDGFAATRLVSPQQCRWQRSPRTAPTSSSSPRWSINAHTRTQSKLYKDRTMYKSSSHHHRIVICLCFYIIYNYVLCYVNIMLCYIIYYIIIIIRGDWLRFCVSNACVSKTRLCFKNPPVFFRQSAPPIYVRSSPSQVQLHT